MGHYTAPTATALHSPYCHSTTQSLLPQHYTAPTVTALHSPYCHSTTQPLHHETHVLPLKQHMRMRGTHIYTSTSNPSHPLHHLRQAPTRPPRRSHLPHTTPAKYYKDSP